MNMNNHFGFNFKAIYQAVDGTDGNTYEVVIVPDDILCVIKNNNMTRFDLSGHTRYYAGTIFGLDSNVIAYIDSVLYDSEFMAVTNTDEEFVYLANGSMYEEVDTPTDYYLLDQVTGEVVDFSEALFTSDGKLAGYILLHPKATCAVLNEVNA